MKKRRAKARGSSAPMTRWAQMPAIAVLFALVAQLILVGCATSPVAPEGAVVDDIGPAHVLKNSESAGLRVIWGGQIVALRNLAEFTEISVVAYPLDGADRPRTDAEPGVRFLIREAGFLEPVKFAPGRFITVLGIVQGTQETFVDEFALTQPMVEAEALHLWPADPRRWSERTRFSIGVGIRL